MAQRVTDSMEEGVPAPLHTQAAQDPAHAHVDVRDAGRPALIRQFDVVDPDDLGPVDVDDLLVEDVPYDQELVPRGLELGKVGLPFLRGDYPTIEYAQVRPRQEPHLLFLFQDQARSTRERRPPLHDDIVELAYLLAQRVEDSFPEDIGDEHFPDQGHPEKLPSRAKPPVSVYFPYLMRVKEGTGEMIHYKEKTVRD
ncbi:MAG: hypothetical protein HW408_1706 [Actinobacteria bacterium]|nr:hypothetical protein [Actinomycetota bacterium]